VFCSVWLHRFALLLVLSTAACAASGPPAPARSTAVPAAQGPGPAATNPAVPPRPSADVDLSDPVTAGVAALLERASVGALHTVSQEQQLDAVYDRLFQNAAMPATPRPTDPADLPGALAATGIGKAEGPWYVWDGRNGDFKNPVLRYFFALKPIAGALILKSVSQACTLQKIRCWLKVLQQMDAYPRTNAAVLFVEETDAPTARSISVEFVTQHPNSVYPDVMPFAERIMPGLSTADEPNEPWPQLGAPHSFGSFIAATIVEAIAPLPDTAGTADVTEAVKKRLSYYGVDPRRPWRRGTRKPRRRLSGVPRRRTKTSWGFARETPARRDMYDLGG
jgi:hypothetical protein